MNPFVFNSMTARFGHIYQYSILSKLYQILLTDIIYLGNPWITREICLSVFISQSYVAPQTVNYTCRKFKS